MFLWGNWFARFAWFGWFVVCVVCVVCVACLNDEVVPEVVEEAMAVLGTGMSASGEESTRVAGEERAEEVESAVKVAAQDA